MPRGVYARKPRVIDLPPHPGPASAAVEEITKPTVALKGRRQRRRAVRWPEVVVKTRLMPGGMHVVICAECPDWAPDPVAQDEVSWQKSLHDMLAHPKL